MECSRTLRRFLAHCLTLATVTAAVTVSSAARADDIDTRPVETYVVQERLFRLGLEVNAGLGLLPLNAFDKGLMVEGSVAYHFSNLWAWEVIQGGYVIANVDTGLKQQLLDNFGVQPTELSTMDFLLSTNILITPFYGKLAGLNRSVNHIEIYFPIGLAVAHYQDPAAYQGGPDLGLGLRWFLGTRTSIRLDARDYLLAQSFKNFGITDELLFSLGLSVAFGGDAR
jgi:outer membrane beta-barrel protein